MAYRRPHNRRAHLRRNPNGTTSFVSGTRVNGHSYSSSKHNHNSEPIYYSHQSSPTIDAICLWANRVFWVLAALAILFEILK